MIRVQLKRLENGMIQVVVSVGNQTILFRVFYLTDSEPVLLEVPDE